MPKNESEPILLQIMPAPADLYALSYYPGTAEIYRELIVCLALMQDGSHRYVEMLRLDDETGVESPGTPYGETFLGYYRRDGLTTMNEYEAMANKRVAASKAAK